MGTVILKALVGGIAGILVWIVFEAQAPHLVNDSSWNRFEQSYVFTLGIVIGAAIGAVTGWIQGGKIHMFRGLGLGLVFGAIGIMFGHSVGERMALALSGGQDIQTINFLQRMLCRMVFCTAMGAGLGFAIGGSTWNFKRAVQGLIGGTLAGALGGVVFDPISRYTAPVIQQLRGDAMGSTTEVGIVGRAVLALMLGALIGLFIGLVERFARSAWLRLILGRNEDKEWSIDAPITTIGRGERAAVPLFGDPNVFPIHAQIQRQGPNMYVLVDGGSPLGTFVNGQRIQTAQLMPGSRIQIGNFQLEFLMKNSPSPVRGPETLRSAQAYPVSGYPGGQAAATPYPQAGASPAAQPAPAGGMAPGSLYAATSGSPQAQQAASPVNSPTVAYGAPLHSAAGGLSLVALDGSLAGQRFAVTAPVMLGRESPTVPMSTDTQASRRHAQVQPGQGFLNVSDLGSTNGTYLNGQRIQNGQARPGDVLKVGGTSFRIEP
jgi:pSer/pThr/pTyr-binding forkhead associated (FHA) protein